MKQPVGTVAATLLVVIPFFGHGTMAGSTDASGGLVGDWSFDAVEGTTIHDTSGHGNDALVRSGRLVKGVAGAGLQFDGETTTVTCDPTPSLSPQDGLTVEAWVKLATTDLRAYPSIVRKEGAYALRFDGNRLGLIIWSGGTHTVLSSEKTDWEADRWYHVAGTYDGNQMRLFVEGKEDGNSPLPHTGRIATSHASFGIGSAGGRYRLHGTLDEVRVYTRALTPAEIAAAHARGRASLEKERNVALTPKDIGVEPAVKLRKPPRTIEMVVDGFVWIDAEDFTDYGGWVLDTQFVHLMGSAYLLAAGVGQPVKDATVRFSVRKPGTYYLWVRARNWLPQYSPGQFGVTIEGKPAPHVFGKAKTSKWVWERGGAFTLHRGPVTLALTDKTGYYGRCDALVLTTHPDYTPPGDMEGIIRERSRLTGLSLAPHDGGTFDVIVVGAGAAGSCAALAAARTGSRTALIQDRPVLGGNSSSELGVGVAGAGSSKPNARESGIIEEVGRLQARLGYARTSEAFRLIAEKEPNLVLFLNQRVIGVEMAAGDRIAAVEAVDTLTGGYTLYRGSLFLDCTGDGWVGYYAKADFRMGREARNEFQESLAPEKADRITMSGCLMGNGALAFRAVDTGEPVAFVPPPWAAKLPPPEAFGRRIRHVAGGEWWLEHPGTIDDLWDAEHARDELIRISFGYWDFLKNRWNERRRAATYKLVYVPYMDARRESRRLLGDYILTQNDVQGARVFPDRISYGGWPLDVHHPKGIFSGKEGPFDCDARTPVYTIPFRCLYSRNISNLLFAGRDVSVTHIALGSVRVQSTLATLGQAAGTAAALCVKKQVTPRQLWRRHIAELQQRLLRDDQYIPGIVNEDPHDLARNAKVSASSTMRFEEWRQEDIRSGDRHPLNTPRAVMFPRGAHRELTAVSLLLTSDRPDPTPLTLHVRAAKTGRILPQTGELTTATVPVPPGGEHWVKFPVRCTVDTPFIWVWLPAAQGISWRLVQNPPLGAARAYGAEGRWTRVPGQAYAAAFDPPLSFPVDCSAAHVTNGVTRIVGEKTNLWASDPHRGLPQWVELRWEEPVRFTTVSLTFDTNLNAPWHNIPLPPECVRNYRVEYFGNGNWKPVATVTGNFQRRRVHRFPAVTSARLRVTITATNGGRSARLFEIRVYDGP